VIKFWPKPPRVAEGNDHPFLSLISQAFSLSNDSSHAQKEYRMEIVLIDAFVVPEESKAAT